MRSEEWRDVPGFGGHYLASSRGRIEVKRRTITRLGRGGKTATFVYRARISVEALGHAGFTREYGIDLYTWAQQAWSESQ